MREGTVVERGVSRQAIYLSTGTGRDKRGDFLREGEED